MALRIPPGLGRTILFKNELGELQPPNKESDYINHDKWINETGANPESEVSKYPDFMRKLASMELGKFEIDIVVPNVEKTEKGIYTYEPKIDKGTYVGVVQEDTSVPGGSPSFMFRTKDGKTHWVHISTMYQRLM